MTLQTDVAKLLVAVGRKIADEIDRGDGPISPLIALSDVPPNIKAFVSENSPKFSHETARKLAGSAVACVEAWDGYITIADERSEAILFNVWVHGAGPQFFAQRYQRHPFQLVGSAIVGNDYTIERQ